MSGIAGARRGAFPLEDPFYQSVCGRAVVPNPELRTIRLGPQATSINASDHYNREGGTRDIRIREATESLLDFPDSWFRCLNVRK